MGSNHERQFFLCQPNVQCAADFSLTKLNVKIKLKLELYLDIFSISNDQIEVRVISRYIQYFKRSN